MSLFCWPCNIPISCLKSQRNHAIQKPFISKMSISKTTDFEITKILIFAPTKFNNTFIQTAKCSSSLSSPGELDKGFPTNVVIFVKGIHISFVLKFSKYVFFYDIFLDIRNLIYISNILFIIQVS
ncbi:hypothetical protein PHJA_000540700 [Phtheirospermum japonicum]|uniref:Uncharacterized protein n=1 Tax=Phtheirospermum japonicum TaxID=374723 RepID=A0A830BPP0_9LAMI|nr:hypothetical protein PHJA_000540700 [Phtheirospermum japonicum]